MRKDMFAISPAVRELIKELWAAPTLRERWMGDERVTAVIRKIREAGGPGAIGDLLRPAFDEREEVRTVAREAIAELVALLPADALPRLDESVRRSWAYLEYWRAIRPEIVGGMQTVSAGDRALVCLMASHRNGYVREEALRVMGGDSSIEVVPFILLRQVDWVAPVRLAAVLQIGRRLRPEYA